MNAERMNKANATAKIEGSKEARPPGGFPPGISTEEDFYLLAVPTTANDPPCRKAQMEQTSSGLRQPAGFLPRWESCHWLRICILLSS